MEGIKTTREEMLHLSNAINSNYLDEVIPLPNVTQTEQIEALSDCDHDYDSVYWETETGSHGWCCQTCGKVTQWG
jgi:hypothetical protein